MDLGETGKEKAQVRETAHESALSFIEKSRGLILNMCISELVSNCQENSEIIQFSLWVLYIKLPV